MLKCPKTAKARLKMLVFLGISTLKYAKLTSRCVVLCFYRRRPVIKHGNQVPIDQVSDEALSYAL